MCGINGSISWNHYQTNIHEMNNLIIHRGPDSEGIYTDEKHEVKVQMGMRRLSIIDLHDGQQPISTENEQVSIVFNGEIYNYLAIKEMLIDEGAIFKTKSDTEVILQLYYKKGIEAFSMLDGMFAFSIHDKEKNKVIIARDYFGEKPLYFYHKDDLILWSSELKSMIHQLPKIPAIDITALNLYFRLTYIPAPYTIYESIKKITPNSVLEINLESQEIKKSDISPFHIHRQKLNISFDNAKKEVRNLVEKSVLSRSIADVSIGTFLSGGVDSSIVTVALAQNTEQRINTFSVGFSKKSFDESKKADTVAKMINSHHHHFIFKEKDIADSLEKVLLNFDEPFADSSALPAYFIAQKTSDYVKVVLTGDGGDEVFGGYNKYQIGGINQKYTQFVPKFAHNTLKGVLQPFIQQKDDQRGLKFKINKVLNAIDYQDDFYFKIISLGFANDTHELLNNKFYNNHPLGYYKSLTPKITTLSDFREMDRHMSLEGDMLVKIDRTCMLTSIEGRAPFLNKKIWDYTMQLPENYLMRKGSKKHILKKAFESDFPEGFLDLNKQGFGVPVGDWLRTSLKDELLYLSEVSYLNKQGIFNTHYIQNIIHEHISSKKDHTFKIWTFYCFQKWHENIYKNLKNNT